MQDGTDVLSEIRRDLDAITDRKAKGVMEDIWLEVITSFNGRSTTTPNKTHDLGSVVCEEINTLGAAITLSRRALGLETTPSTGCGRPEEDRIAGFRNEGNCTSTHHFVSAGPDTIARSKYS
ncbi:hypothetical protein EHS25_006424 [Saitozyma podzolica]|uniref:Uncharacterized protein n=1 Tax=Saitozyma podzolica TaxID=1890683 RepID=A0A427YRX6_9TREE|nr:hypothetical protein EHS25_006424 [Saitozyma podzolica]